MTRTIYTYAEKQAIGEVEMTSRQYADYVAAADRDTGAISLGELRPYLSHTGSDLVWSEICDDDTTVYVEE